MHLFTRGRLVVKKGTNGKYTSILSGIALINGTKCHLYEVTVDFEDYRMKRDI